MEFTFIGNDLALDFVNTDFAGGDTLPDFDAFIAWLAAAGAISAGDARKIRSHARGHSSARAFAKMRALRSAMRAVVGAFVDGAKPSTADLALLNSHLEHRSAHDELVFEKTGFASVRRVATGSPESLTYFPAEAARELVMRKQARAIRRCAGDGCTHYFYDASKNRTRRWCSMAGCGNREKAAALRDRRREK